MRSDRLALATLCRVEGEEPVLAMVIGTWAYTRAEGSPGMVETRERRWRSDPQTDETANGYLLLPSKGTGFIYAHFGDVAIGDLVPIT